MKTFNFKSFFSSIGQKTHCITTAENEKSRKRLENDSKTIGYVTGTWRESGARVAKYAAMLIAVLILGIGQVWATSGTITAASTTDLGKGNTPRHVVEQAGVGRLMKNATGSSSWSVSDGKLTTGSSKFALQTYNAISSIVINGYGTGSGRTFSSMRVGTTTGNYAAASATGSGTMSSTESSQTITITPSSTIAANSYVEITLSGNIYIYSVELVYAGGGGGTSHNVSAVTSTGTNTYGSVSAGSTTVVEGGTTTITATPAAGYRVTNWAVSGTGASISPTGASNSTTTTLTMGTADATVTVTFGAIPTHTITYTNTKSMDNSANPTSYYEGVGVASFTKLRHAVGYDFTGWSPSSISSSATTNQTIDAQWTARAAAAGTGTLTYALAFSSSTITTSSITRNNGALYDATDVSVAHTSFSDGSTKNGCSGKLTTTSSKNGTNYVELTFKIADGYTFTPTEVSVRANAVSTNKTLEVELKDNAATPNSKSVTGALAQGSTSGGATVTLDFDASGEVALEGTVTAKIFVYGATDAWRLGTSIVITGTVASAAPSCTAPTTTFGNGEYTVGGSALDLSTLIGSNNSSGAITYTVKNANGTGASISTASFTATTAGTCTVTATQAANGDKCEKVMDATITVNATPSISSFSPASGSTIKSGTTITVSGSSSSTVYCLWASSAKTASQIQEGTAGTSGAAAVTSAGIASANGTTLYAVATRGGATSSISSASYTIDDTAPTLYSSNPANGATGVATSGTIVLTFSEEIANVDGSKFTLTGATIGAVAKDGSDATKVNIAYSGASNSTTVTLATAAGAVSDAAGNTSAALSSISFTTEAAATYTVTYNGSSPDGGSVPEDANSPYESGATVTVLGNTGNLTKAFEPEPSELVPATFIGWNTNSNTYGGTHYDANDQFTISGNTTLYAVWGYPITYDADGGTINDASYPSYYICTYPDDDATTTLPSDVTKTGYDFDGWYTSNGSGSKVTAINGDYTGAFSGDHALKAIWTANSYTITLNKGDHGAANQSASVLYDATALTSITHVTATGYDRTGYFDGSTKVLNADGSFANDDIAGYITDGKWSKTADASLTAKWSAQTYTISYKDQGDNTYSGSNGGSLPTSHTYGNATDFVNGVKSGYRFMGWYTDASCTVSAGSSIGATAITANTTYYAKWAQLYTITNGEPSNGTITVVTEAIEGETVSITASPNSEYNFDAWSVYKTGDPETTISPDEATASTSFTMPAYGVTVDATFVVKTYSVTYNGNGRTGGSAVPTDATAYTSGQTVTVKAGSGMAKTGYTFIGWLSGDNTLYQYGQTFTITANTTLTAQWDGTGSSITITNFATSNTSTSNNIPDDNSKYFYGYKGSVSDANAVTITSNDGNDHGQNSGDEMRLTYNKKMRVYANNITNATPGTFSRVTAISFKWKFIASGNSGKTVLSSSYTVKVGSTTVANAVSISGATNDGYKTVTISGLNELNGYVEILFGGSSSSYNVYLDDITITCATNTAKTVTFNKGSGPSTVTGLPAAVKVPSGSKIARPATDPSATNYIFDGWVTTGGGSTPFDFSTTISSNTTIFASWRAKTAPEQYTFSLSDPCASASPSATLSGSQSGWSYQLYKDGVASGDPKAGTGNALTWTGLTAGSYYVKTVETSTQASAQIGSSATVYAGTSISTNLASSRAVNANVSTTVSFVASGASLSYQWYTCNSDGTGKVAVGTNSPQFTNTFTNDDAPTKYICCVATGTCGTVTSNIQTVTITPTYLLTYDANGGNGAPAAAYRAATTAALSSTQPTRSNHRFLGWNTEDDGSGTHYAAGASFPMPAEATTLYAEWQEEASLQWVPNLNTGESSIGTNSKSSTNTTRIPTSAMSAISNYGSLTITSSAKSDLTSKIQAPTSYDAGKYMYVTFTVPANYEFVPSSASVKVQPVDGAGDVQLELCDANGHSISKTQSSVASGSSTTITMTNDLGVALNGTVTLKIYCYGGSTGTYRLGSPIAISGDVNYECPERPTVTTPASPQDISVFADKSKTLVVEVTPYNSGALSYQWKKDGEEIDGATTASYTIVGSTLTLGTEYAYTCDITEVGACAIVTSPAYNVIAVNGYCGDTEIAKATRSGTSASYTGKTGGSALVNNLDRSSYKLKSGGYVGVQLPSTLSFRVGDEISIDLTTGDWWNGANVDELPVVVYADNTGTNEIYRTDNIAKNTATVVEFTVTSSMLTALASKQVTVYRKSSTETQNHVVNSVSVSRYICPDGVVEFNDANEDGLWSTTANWVGATGQGDGLPTSDVRALITKPVTVNVANAVAGEVVIDQHSSNTGKLTIPSTGVLKVEGPITKTTNGTSLSATAVADVVIDCGETSQGALIFEQPSSGLQTKGTVNFYTKSSRVGGKLQWQYVGYPFISGYDYDYGGYYINKYSETQGGWIVMRDQGDRSIAAWDGLAISGDGAGGASMTGTFVPTTGDKALTLTYTAGKGKGKNLIGNSWTAPIQILEMEEEDFGGARATLYVFNTGRYGSKEVSPSGSWVTLAIDAVKAGVDAGTWTNLTVIPAFQGFQVKTAATANKTLTLNYDKHVRPATDDDAMNEPLRAPARRANSEINHMRLTVESDVAHQDVFLFEGPEFSEDFDNGWDGDYVGVSGQHAYLYVVSPTLGKMAIDAESSLEGRIVALQSAAEKEYTFTFAGNGMGYYLNDLKTQTSTLIEAGNSYTFTYEQGDDYNRFMISATPFAKTTPTGVDKVQGDKVQSDKVRKVLIDDHLYIIRAGKMFDATGGRIK